MVLILPCLHFSVGNLLLVYTHDILWFPQAALSVGIKEQKVPDVWQQGVRNRLAMKVSRPCSFNFICCRASPLLGIHQSSSHHHPLYMTSYWSKLLPRQWWHLCCSRDLLLQRWGGMDSTAEHGSYKLLHRIPVSDVGSCLIFLSKVSNTLLHECHGR
jgi:hypothetical protein